MRALVTGAGKRLGRAMAEAVGARGADVWLHYHQSEAGAREAQRNIEASGGRAFVGSADLSDLAQARELVQRAIADLGGLDLLVVSAASFERGGVDSLDDAGFERSLRFILQSSFALAQEAAPALRASQGSIVFITCTSSVRPFRGYLGYSVAKGALRQLMLGLAQELAPAVRVNAIAPGTVLPPPETTAEEHERYAHQALLDRVGEADDVVRALLYLVDAPFVTAQELRVDGGRL
ncbi:MAG TPA: SDR family oxidoreductase [Polyangiaceae bacterium]|nr:SDR family oxidoreductase [Polyangiaceae bacterium]